MELTEIFCRENKGIHDGVSGWCTYILTEACLTRNQARDEMGLLTHDRARKRIKRKEQLLSSRGTVQLRRSVNGQRRLTAAKVGRDSSMVKRKRERYTLRVQGREKEGGNSDGTRISLGSIAGTATSSDQMVHVNARACARRKKA